MSGGYRHRWLTTRCPVWVATTQVTGVLAVGGREKYQEGTLLEAERAADRSLGCGSPARVVPYRKSQTNQALRSGRWDSPSLA